MEKNAHHIVMKLVYKSINSVFFNSITFPLSYINRFVLSMYDIVLNH